MSIWTKTLWILESAFSEHLLSPQKKKKEKEEEAEEEEEEDEEKKKKRKKGEEEKSLYLMFHNFLNFYQ